MVSEAVYGTNSFKFSECSDLLKQSDNSRGVLSLQASFLEDVCVLDDNLPMSFPPASQCLKCHCSVLGPSRFVWFNP